MLISRYDQIAGRVGSDAHDEARARLERAVVNTLSGDVPGLIPPQHIAQIIDVINKNRPVVNTARRTQPDQRENHLAVHRRPSDRRQAGDRENRNGLDQDGRHA